ncbi:MAG TPA: Na+/H+ antiporter subunit E [Candidatus Marinimicrobia bacterium]|jgi:multicomponent Na+:H+ antiporter subunit E|nr:Na+/H+ antiporter subunit E [Candidatus Neomarinimicrobiota bacterium]HOU17677.1 Na+/H+ antiporter subunit E [Candidatus Neomarinimicrobiota bacterium]HOV23734.1 Na+/H+ antiporter subunit E [Candidatus Neomarinimicrobiota bacterium]HPC36943.1 Na+/H+ antiporter subunit E [Candidatus Neomarinimicrobiota bacterium]HQE95567.1 Na+/H+ antiporter subunit E [Candidatus Neomarinimicrobiota bacterium]
MTIKNRSRVIVFVLSFLVWLALTDIKDIQEVVAGLIVAFLVSLIAGTFLVTTEKSRHPVRRFFMGIVYLFKFLWEMIKANIHVALIVINPTLPIKPGIIKIKSNLTKDSALTVLTNSITLTPGTLTVDINPETREIYIHCIEVESTAIDENTRSIGGRFEKLIREVFE